MKRLNRYFIKLKQKKLIGFHLIITVLLFTCNNNISKLKDELLIPLNFEWENTNLSFDTRVDLLIKDMTLKEKISQLRYNSPAIDRLCIPEYNWFNEALNGVARPARATVFPQNIGLAATFDESLIKKIGYAISDERRAIYNEMRKKRKLFKQYTGLTYLSPNVNIFRASRLGGSQETLGEDPLLAGRLASAFIRGMKGDNPKYLKISTCAKHFALHNGLKGKPDAFNTLASNKYLFETYLAEAKAYVDAGVEFVMYKYNLTDNEFYCGSNPLSNSIWVDKFCFNGKTISNPNTGNYITKNLEESIVLALQSGINLNYEIAYQEIKDAIEKELVSESLIDELLKPLLLTRFKLGMFDPIGQSPFDSLPISLVNSKKNKELAKEAALKSIVLLQNKKHVLPLKKDSDILYIAGPLAGNIQAVVGNYNGLSGNVKPIITGIAEKVSNITRIEYRSGALFNSPKKNSMDWYSDQSNEVSATIVVLGFTSKFVEGASKTITSVSHGENLTMKLPENQIELLRKLKKEKKPVVAVICSGSPIDLSEILDLTDALLFAWYPGEAGAEAIADIIFGDISPSGKLPITFPKSVERLPQFNDYSMVGKTYKYMENNVLFPFGFGLNYGNIELSNLEIDQSTSGKTYVSIIANNSGKYKTDEVIQLYISLIDSTLKVPVQELKCFKRVEISENEKQRIFFEIDNNDIFYYDKNGEKKIYHGKVKLYLGLNALKPDANEDFKKGISKIIYIPNENIY